MAVDTTIIQTDTISQAQDGWSVPVTFQQLDTIAGSLISVGLSLTGTVTGIAAIENLGSIATTTEVSVPGTIALNAGTIVVDSAHPDAAGTISLDAYDGTVDFAGSSGTIAVFTNSGTGTLTSTAGSLSQYIGDGTVGWTATSQASLTEYTNGNVLSVTRAEAGATVDLHYNATETSGSNSSSDGVSASEIVYFNPQTLFNAATLAPQTVSVDDATSGWDVTRSIAQFDPSLGTLVAVEFTVKTDIDTGLVVENLGSVAGVSSVNATALMTIAVGGSVLGVGTASDQTFFDLGAFDGSIDFAGTSGANLAGSANSGTITGSITQGLSTFIGGGSIDLDLSSASFAQMSGPADLAFEQLLQTGGTVEVSYVFQPAATITIGTGSLISGPLAIVGTQANQADIQTAIDNPFSTVSIDDNIDVNETETLTITESNPLNGTLGVFLNVLPYNNPEFDSTTGVYTAQGSAASLSALLQELEFKPTYGTVLPGQTIETDFTITVMTPGGTAVTDTTASVIQIPGVFVDTVSASIAVQTALGDTTVNQTPLVTQSQQQIACFTAGTRIATPNGPVAVEHLREGDLVLTESGTPQPINWIGRRTLDCRRHPDPARIRPIRIARHAFGMNRPSRAVLLSPDHAVYVEDVLIPVKFLLNGTTITQTRAARVTYFHLELPRHDVVLAENLPCESYLETGGRSCFENAGAALALHPDFAGSDEARVGAIWQAQAYAPLIGDEATLQRVQARLAFQALMLQGQSRWRSSNNGSSGALEISDTIAQ